MVTRTKKIPVSTRKKTKPLNDKMMKQKWKPGQSGNPNGRPKGSRNKFSELFIDELLKDFELNGSKALRRCRVEDPAAYLRVCASILPKELNVNADETAIDQLLEKLDDQELENIINGLAAVGATSKGHASKAKERTGIKSNTVH